MMGCRRDDRTIELVLQPSACSTSEMTTFRTLLRRLRLPPDAADEKPNWRIASDSDHARYDRVIIGLASVAAVGAYAFQYLQPYLEPSRIFAAGFCVIMGLLTSIAMPRKNLAAWQVWTPLLAIGFGGLLLAGEGMKATTASRWNDQRCRIIQDAMLRPKPRTRTDLPSLFEALKCRPQGADPLDPSYRPPSIYDGSPPSAPQEARHERFLQQALKAEVVTEMAIPMPQQPSRFGSKSTKQ